jgi:hypothetical protein
MTHFKSTVIGLTIILGSTLLTSCDKEKNNEVTEEDAVTIIEGSLQESSAGVGKTIPNFAELLVTDFAINNNCNQTYDTTYIFNHSGAIVQADYVINWGFILNCNFGVPNTAELNASSSGIYSTNRMTSDDNTTTNLNISGIQPSSSNLVFSGDLTREGFQTITINSNSSEITSTIALSLSNVIVNKTTYEIESGAGTALLTANNGTDSFTFSGEIIFNGGGSATLIINGNSYTISF